MKMAVAVESPRHPKNNADYRIWYLQFNAYGDVASIGTISKDKLVRELMQNHNSGKKSVWRAFLSGDDRATSIELYDFISQNTLENTHFGNLPTLSEFQSVLDQLEINISMREVA